MPIDLQSEDVLSLTQAAKTLPRRRRGKKPHVATLYRWAANGLRGVRLETLQVGGTMCTSMEALQRFFDRLGDRSSPVSTATSIPRRRAMEKADEQLAKEGF